jgi:putative peptide zinc metalloprotease protein
MSMQMQQGGLPFPGGGGGEGEQQEEQPLPRFRRDLELYRAPDEPDGSPAYSILDPISAQYYKITWGEAMILKMLRPGMKISELIVAIEGKTTLKVKPEEIMLFFEQAKRTNLLVMPKPASQVMNEWEMRKVHPLKWLLFHYLYFKVPVFNPDKFLKATLPMARFLTSRVALMLYVCVIVSGLFYLVGRLDQFLHTFPYFFSVTGVIAYSTAIIATKIIHELSHGYVAKHYDVRVPSMGLAFIIFWPVMYTDVTDSWKLDSRKQRLAISGAGVIAELVLAGLCTLGWAMTSPGVLQSIFFIVSSVTWISTLLVNINPAMRFDGYYLFSDILGVDNLQMRAFAYTRWRLRKWLLGVDIPPPEIVVERKMRIGMMAYSVYTWIYRLFLYTAIAVMIYLKFAKALGIFLFFLEIAIFLVWPFFSELKGLIQMRSVLSFNRRSIVTIIILFMLLLWAVVPWPHSRSFSSVTVPETQQVVYLPRAGAVDRVFVKRGEDVVVGQPLVRIFSKELEVGIAEIEAEKRLLETEINMLSGSLEDSRALIPEKMAERASVEEQLRGLHEQRKQNMIFSNITGTIYDWDDTVIDGQAVAKDQILGRIADLSKIYIMSFVPEEYISDLKVGREVEFTFKGEVRRIKGYVERISPIRATMLNYPQLSSLYHGDLPVMPGRNRELMMVESYYAVTITLENVDNLDIGRTGYSNIRLRWRSFFWDFLRKVWSLFWEESTF